MSEHRPTLMISTCGTSMLTYQAEPQTRELLKESANWQQVNLAPAQRQTIDQRIEACRAQLGQAPITSIRKMSAELNGLFGFYGDRLPGRSQDQHVLLHTDTYQGSAVADVLEAYLRGHGLNVLKQTFANLRTDRIEDFHHGIAELILWCDHTLPGYRQRQYQIAFNLTGGFKSIQGWMQTLGMFYADEIVYIFESGRELLRIPRIPVAIEDGARRTIEAHLDLFRRLAPAGASCPADAVSDDIAEVFFYRIGDEAELSPWGRLVWGRCRKEIYEIALHAPPSPCIRYSEKFKRAAHALAQDRLVDVNERIDDLAIFLRDGANPNRLDFKQLKNNPRPPSTHECDAWADQSAWRIFCHFDGQTLVLDDLGEGLH